VNALKTLTVVMGIAKLIIMLTVFFFLSLSPGGVPVGRDPAEYDRLRVV